MRPVSERPSGAACSAVSGLYFRHRKTAAAFRGLPLDCWVVVVGERSG